MLQIGEKAPDFTAPGQGGEPFSLSDALGKQIILYFYPRDDTPGCTTEALDFTARMNDFAQANTIVVGVSKDSVEKHVKFIKKHDLNVILVSDEHTTICEDYGTWVEKKMYGKTFMGIDRTTFLINEQGEIANIWTKVKVPGHVDAVLDAVKQK